MFNLHDYAFQTEITVIAIFNCEKYDLGSMSVANFIEKDPFIAIAIVLADFYNKVDISFKEKIDEFLIVYYLEMGKSIPEIGEVKIKDIIKDFNKLSI